VDALIVKAAASADVVECKHLYKQIRTITSSDAPLAFTHYKTLNYLMNKNVTGSIITPTLSLYMENFGFTETSRS
jgi:peptide/nickel transport system substrate-binding protein